MEPTDESKIRDMLAVQTRHWIRHEMDAWGAFFTDDCDFITHRGLWWRTRQANVDGHKDVPASVVAQKRSYAQEIVSIQDIAPGVALVHTRWTWPEHRLPNAEAPEDRGGLITMVLVKHRDEWKIRAVHNTRVNGLDDFADKNSDRRPQSGRPAGSP
ncbi:SgcJ/EcaC family oxidoreductase [Spirillospora sp. NPDC029432]|uniref:YybH family protein n=1 Tax=Spirillospora sp. NPDC029432 TaxID=3154599 RepID=UPI003452F982